MTEMQNNTYLSMVMGRLKIERKIGGRPSRAGPRAVTPAGAPVLRCVLSCSRDQLERVVARRCDCLTLMLALGEGEQSLACWSGCLGEVWVGVKFQLSQSSRCPRASPNGCPPDWFIPGNQYETVLLGSLRLLLYPCLHGENRPRVRPHRPGSQRCGLGLTPLLKPP